MSQDTATQCNTLQHIATHTATHCDTLRLVVGWLVRMSQHTAAHCNTLQHTATHCNTLQHTATHCNAHRNTLLHSTFSRWLTCHESLATLVEIEVVSRFTLTHKYPPTHWGRLTSMSTNVIRDSWHSRETLARVILIRDSRFVIRDILLRHWHESCWYVIRDSWFVIRDILLRHWHESYRFVIRDSWLVTFSWDIDTRHIDMWFVIRDSRFVIRDSWFVTFSRDIDPSHVDRHTSFSRVFLSKWLTQSFVCLSVWRIQMPHKSHCMCIYATHTKFRSMSISVTHTNTSRVTLYVYQCASHKDTISYLFLDQCDYRSLLQKSPIKETIFCKRDL